MPRVAILLTGAASLVVGCVWSSPPIVAIKPVVVPVDPVDELVDIKADELPEGATCETAGDADIPQGHVELSICHLGDHADTPEQEAQGFIQHDMRANLVLTGKHRVTTTIGTWTDGWEWGSSYQLVGPLVKKRSGAIVITSGSSEAGPGSSSVGHTLHVFAVDKTGWHDVHQLGATSVDLTFEPSDPSVGTVTTCETLPLGQTSTNSGCKTWSDAAPGATTRLVWTGHEIEATLIPPPADDKDDDTAP